MQKEQGIALALFGLAAKYRANGRRTQLSGAYDLNRT
jgi:hypothetical protein